MKKLIAIITMFMCVNLAYAINHQYKPTYSYGIHEIDKELLIKNLRSNVAPYIEHQGWRNDKRTDFEKAYKVFLEALKEPNRLYTDDFGEMWDREGEIAGDKNLYWYDRNGNKISNAEYNSLKKKHKANYHRFYPYSEFVKYFNTITKAVLKNLGKI